ncbi:uncharacterized protein LOC117786745 [Drosophila innubila]|uniref:uncharacterized protein LOC117786745 n=1 Tax=Drosophila innubila TaxID=198719 RepID=UPI00148E055A|nr:uncharacterized protein LOC117786745 [Drosophila innubila]
MQLKELLPWLLLLPALQAAVLPLDVSLGLPLESEKFGYLELKPNGTLILSQADNQSGSQLQNLLLLRSVLQALKLQPTVGQAKLNIKIYGDGVEQKFPPILENVLQRIQTFFSIYRYTDTSRPVRQEKLTTEPPKKLQTSTTEIVENLNANDNIATVPPLHDDYITVGEEDNEIIATDPPLQHDYITVGEDE